MARIDAGSQSRMAPVAPQSPPPAARTEAPASRAPSTSPSSSSSPPQARQPSDGFDRTRPANAAAPAGSRPVGAPPERLTRDFSSEARNQIRYLANSRSQNTQVSTNRDGSETRSRTSNPEPNHTRTSELTTRRGMLGDAQTQFSRTDKTTFEGGSNEERLTASAQSNVLGLTSSSETRSETRTRGDAANGGETSTTTSRTESRDRLGFDRQVQSETQRTRTGTEQQSTTQSTTQTQTTDSRGNSSESTQTQTVTRDGRTTTTTSSRSTQGTELNGSVNVGARGVSASVERRNNLSSTERTFTRETELRPSTADRGFSQQNQNDRLNQAQRVGDVLGATGARTTLAEGRFGEIQQNPLVETGPNSFVGTRHGVTGQGSVTAGADGLRAQGGVEARAGLHAETRTQDIPQGEAGLQGRAAARLEARAHANGEASLNTNGLNASANAGARVTAETSATVRAQSGSVEVAGVPLNSSAEGTLRLSATAGADLQTRAQVTRNPPTAILEGSAGASAVAKAEAEGRVSAGPFSLRGNVYGSAGAEATARGSIGYEDGKLRISAGAGAALGLGVGGGAALEVDVGQIGNMARNTATAAAQRATQAADVNGDGRLGMDDAQAVAQAVQERASSAVSAVQERASSAVSAVQERASNAASAVQDRVNSAASRVRNLFGF